MNAFAKNKQTIREKRERISKLFFSTTFRVGVIFCMIFTGFLYVWQTNTISTKGYAMTDLEQQIRILENENRRIEVEIAQHTSIQRVQDHLAQVNMVPATDVAYVTLVGSAVARR